MRWVYTAKGFKGHWPVGTSAVIVAKDKIEALTFLNLELSANGLPPTTFDDCEIKAVQQNKPKCIILNDGNY